MPLFTLIAGPNGSGKSSLSEWVDLVARGLLLDADAIAREMNPLNPQNAAFAAGRRLLERANRHLRQKESFAVETTLSGKGSLAMMAKARSRGYEVHLIFVALDGPERSIQRIRTRASLGGHFVPDSDVRRRYKRSIDRLPAALRLADIANVYDNSSDQHRLILVVKNGVAISRSSDLPAWVQKANAGV